MQKIFSNYCGNKKFARGEIQFQSTHVWIFQVDDATDKLSDEPAITV